MSSSFTIGGGSGYTNKFAMSNVSEDKKEIRFTISKSVKEEMTKAIIESKNYHRREKSRWVYEAILLLMKNPNYKEIVLNADGSDKTFVHDKVNLTFDQRCVFSEARNSVVREYPDIKGPQGSVLRAAISYRLSRNY